MVQLQFVVGASSGGASVVIVLVPLAGTVVLMLLIRILFDFFLYSYFGF